VKTKLYHIPNIMAWQTFVLSTASRC